jgi:proline iminopeptidase
MNTELNADKRVDPLEAQIDRLRDSLPPSTVIIGVEGDPRPATFLQALGTELGRDVSIIVGAGHEPWLERPAEFTAVFRAAVRSTPLARVEGGGRSGRTPRTT